jgi:hypothetical protein
VAADPARREVLEAMRARLDEWMRESDDPLLDGPVEPPPGALVNEQWQISPDDPVRVVGDSAGAASAALAGAPGPRSAPSS